MSVIWASDIDGKIGEGTSITTNNLSVGDHTITLTVTDKNGANNEDKIELEVCYPNKIIFPASSYTVEKYDNFFYITAGIPEGIQFASRYLKVRDKDSAQTILEYPIKNMMLAEYAYIEFDIFNGNSPPVGYCNLSIYAFKADGLVDYSDIYNTDLLIEQFSHSGNGYGAALEHKTTYRFDITGILNDFIVSETEYIGFVIRSEKAENCIPRYSINSYSKYLPFIHVNFGSSEPLPRISSNNPPEAKIESPSSEENFEEGDEITFVGTAKDWEDGTIDEKNMVWVSSIDGKIGTGPSFKTSNLSRGYNKISLIVKDSRGQNGISSVYINIW